MKWEYGLEVGQKGRVCERRRLKGLEHMRRRGQQQRAGFIQMSLQWRGGLPYLYALAAALDRFIHRLMREFNLIALLMPFDYTRNVKQLRARNPCALCPGGVFWLFTKIKSVTVKMCDKFLQYTPLLIPAPHHSLCLYLSMPTLHSLCALQSTAGKLMHITSCTLITICIQTEDRQEKKKKKKHKRLKAIRTCSACFSWCDSHELLCPWHLFRFQEWGTVAVLCN